LRKNSDRLSDILEAIEAIERYTGAGKAEFDHNELIRVWCLRHLEVMGEAVARLSDDLRAHHVNIPWRDIIGMRNILIHGYFDVDWDRVWLAASRDIPQLKNELKKILTDEA
jgi:uncharacterized protein with HEPN domain